MNIIGRKLYIFGGFMRGDFTNCFLVYDLYDKFIDLIDNSEIT